jgi:hypothetical protein
MSSCSLVNHQSILPFSVQNYLDSNTFNAQLFPSVLEVRDVDSFNITMLCCPIRTSIAFEVDNTRTHLPLLNINLMKKDSRLISIRRLDRVCWVPVRGNSNARIPACGTMCSCISLLFSRDQSDHSAISQRRLSHSLQVILRPYWLMLQSVKLTLHLQNSANPRCGVVPTADRPGEKWQPANSI